MPKWQTKRYNDIRVYYLPSLHGGGMTYGQDFIPLVKKMFGKVNRICEVSSGPGFIGFSLLANKLCNSVCLVDVNPEAIKACNKTIKENNLRSLVKTFESNSLENVHESEKWDLVVCNPPHFNRTVKNFKKDLIGVDKNWEMHKKFYKKIKKHLTKNGSILFVENLAGSTPEIWKTIIKQAGLSHVETIFYNPNLLQKIYRAALEAYLTHGLNPVGYFSLFTNKDIYQKANGWIFAKPYQFYFIFSKP